MIITTPEQLSALPAGAQVERRNGRNYTHKVKMYADWWTPVGGGAEDLSSAGLLQMGPAKLVAMPRT
jgi:hypothetical protein